MFSWTAPSFAKIPCPAQNACNLQNCFFDHADGHRRSATAPEAVKLASGAKRRRLNDSSPKRAEPKSSALLDASALVGPQADRAHAKRSALDSPRSLASKAVPANAVIAGARPSRSDARPEHTQKPEVVLKPKALNVNPTGHGMRYQYLKGLHKVIGELNDKLKACKPIEARLIAIDMDAAALIEMAVEEEAKIATENPKVYPNVIKLRLQAYQKMTVEQFVKEVTRAREQPAPERPAQSFPRESDVDLHMNDARKRNLLDRLICSQEGLAEHGYVTAIPPDETLREAMIADERMKGFETCARCDSYFQVFPDRREDGALTSGGKCSYHWGRLRGKKGEADKYQCCGEEAGKPGCTIGDTHVFEVKDAGRQSLVLPFMTTPENSLIADERAVAIDCEMGFTTRGNEVIRLTALLWPGGSVLLDFLIRPVGTVLDFNTRFSGVKAAEFSSAAPYDGSMETLQIVQSPAVARKLLFEQIKPTTPLIGHAIENDLRAMRVVHPTLVDTVLLCPHPLGKLPRRRALRDLARHYLGRTIQTAAAAGHDSHEDALATGDVVDVLVKIKWHELKRNGWIMVGDDAVSPKDRL